MPENISEPSEQQISGQMTRLKKRKVSLFNIIFLIILLTLIGISALYYSGDESKLNPCTLADECKRYNIFYITGQGYVCANEQIVGNSGIKEKILMFKYASKKAVTNEPAGCLCLENSCEIEEVAEEIVE